MLLPLLPNCTRTERGLWWSVIILGLLSSSVEGTKTGGGDFSPQDGRGNRSSATYERDTQVRKQGSLDSDTEFRS